MNAKRILMLDFGGSFNLLLPNVREHQVFRTNSTDIEVQVRPMTNGQKLTFMRFVFRNPPTQISAPVLDNQKFAMKVIMEGSPCVLLGRPNVQGMPLVQAASSMPMAQQPQPVILQRQDPPRYSTVVPQAAVHINVPVQESPMPSNLSISPVQSKPANLMPTNSLPANLVAGNSIPAGPVSAVPANQVPANLVPGNSIPAGPVSAVPANQVPANLVPGNSIPAVMPAATTQKKSKKETDPPPNEVTIRLCQDKVKDDMLFPEDIDQTLYQALKPDELEKIIKCRFCGRKFTFLSEHLVHMKMHTHDVDSIVEMSIKIWVQDRKLRCDMCKKFKTSYTLDYAKHRDSHQLGHLTCGICKKKMATPNGYSQHLEIHHSSHIMSTLTQSDLEVSKEPDPVIPKQVDPVVAQPNEDLDTVIEANIGKDLDDEKMLESIFNEEKEHAKRTKSVDSVGSEANLLEAIEKCGEVEQALFEKAPPQIDDEDLDQRLAQAVEVVEEQKAEDERQIDNCVLDLAKDCVSRIDEQNFDKEEFEVKEDEEKIEHRCQTCGDEFVTSTSLKIHRLKCKGKSESCESCGNQFRSATSLKMHKTVCKLKKTESRRQYVIPNELPDVPVVRDIIGTVPVTNAMSSDDDDDHDEGIWRRKSDLARERRRVWLERKQQPPPPPKTVEPANPLSSSSSSSSSSDSSDTSSSSEDELAENPKELPVKLVCENSIRKPLIKSTSPLKQPEKTMSKPIVKQPIRKPISNPVVKQKPVAKLPKQKLTNKHTPVNPLIVSPKKKSPQTNVLPLKKTDIINSAPDKSEVSKPVNRNTSMFDFSSSSEEEPDVTSRPSLLSSHFNKPSVKKKVESLAATKESPPPPPKKGLKLKIKLPQKSPEQTEVQAPSLKIKLGPEPTGLKIKIPKPSVAQEKPLKLRIPKPKVPKKKVPKLVIKPVKKQRKNGQKKAADNLQSQVDCLRECKVILQNLKTKKSSIGDQMIASICLSDIDTLQDEMFNAVKVTLPKLKLKLPGPQKRLSEVLEDFVDPSASTTNEIFVKAVEDYPPLNVDDDQLDDETGIITKDIDKAFDFVIALGVANDIVAPIVSNLVDLAFDECQQKLGSVRDSESEREESLVPYGSDDELTEDEVAPPPDLIKEDRTPSEIDIDDEMALDEEEEELDEPQIKCHFER